MENPTINSITDDYIISVDIESMKYKTISENDFFGIPASGRYQELIHRFTVNYIHPDDRDIFINIFSADAMKKSSDNNVRILSEEIKFLSGEKVYYKNINAVIYKGKEGEGQEIIISFLDVTGKKEKQLNEYSLNPETQFRRSHNLILNVNLEKNTYSIAVANGSIIPGRKTGIFTDFLTQFVSLIDDDRKEYILEQCQPEKLMSEFSNQETEIYFRFKVKKNRENFLWMSLCAAAAPDFGRNSSAFIIIKYMDSDAPPEHYMPADVVIDSRFDIFAARCLNILSVETADTEKCVNEMLRNICGFLQADTVLVFTPEEVLPSVMRPAFMYSARKGDFKGAAKLSGFDYAIEMQKLNDSIENNHFITGTVGEIENVYPNIYKYLKTNNIERISLARVNFGLDKKGIICIEDFSISLGEMENSVNLSAIFLGLAMDRLSLHKNNCSMKSMRRRHNELLTLVYNRMYNGIIQFEVDLETNAMRLLNFNDALCVLVGCSKEVIQHHFSKDFFRFAIDEDREQLADILKDLVTYRKQKTWTEVRIMDKKGDIKWVHIRIFRINDDNGKKAYIQAEFTDITDIKHDRIEKDMVYDAMSGGTLKFIVKDRRLEYVSVNDEFCKFFEVEKFEDVLGIIGRDKYERFLEKYYDKFANRESFKTHLHISLKSGMGKWVSISAKCIGTKSGYPLYMIVFIDMTELENAYTELEKMNMELKIRTQRYNLIEEITNEKIIDYDFESDRIIIQNKFSGGDEKEVIIENFYGMDFDGSFRDYVYGDDLEYYIQSMKKILGGTGKGSFDYRSRMYDDNEYKWYRAFCTTITDNDGRRVRLIARVQDIEKEKSKQRKMEIQIKSDPMTGLLNKVAARTEIIHVLENDKDLRHAMLIIDVDNFKAVNDNLGHMFGDAVLKNISSAIKRTFRSSDIVGRIGGDEFIVLMINAGDDIVVKKAGELCSSIKRCYNGINGTVEVSCSIGIAYSDFPECDYDTLFNMADKAVYASKTNGKNRYTVYSENMTESNHIITREENNAAVQTSNEINMDIISFAISLLSNSKDIDSSVSILLEQISNRYDITDIIIFESDKNGNVYSSNAWPENYSISDSRISLRMNDGSSFNMQSNSILCIDDCSEHKEELPFRMEGIKSYAIVSSGDNFDGIMIVFGDNRSKRHWNHVQKNTLCEVTKLISIFITLRNEREADRKKIEMLRTTDALTGLYNFEEFKIKATELIRKSIGRKKFAICYMDVNGFLYVNENFGYNAGDRILCDLARCIETVNYDEIYTGCACRVYSDYFILLVCAETRSSIMDKIKESNDTFFEIQRKAYPAGSIGLSTGIYFIDDDFCDISIAIDNADLARKKAKRTNQNTYEIYTDELRTIRSNELSIIGELYRAMEKGRIELFLQPKFHLATRKIIGAEALARWRNDDCSLKYPSEFVPALEKIGYIVKLDFYMYEKVLESMRKWQNLGVELMPISVNFSRKNSMEDGFYERVHELAEAYGIDRKYIEIETTESTFIADEVSMFDIMGRFRNAGFKVDIDDFGTGYSSLSMLVTAPVDIVKIDKSFLKNIEDSQCEREYVKQMCKMIGTAKKDIIFEGVETEEQAAFLLECGFTKAQGFLFDKPIHIREFERKYLNIKED